MKNLSLDIHCDPDLGLTRQITQMALLLVKENPCVNREYLYSIVVYQKYLTSLGEMIIFEHGRENYHFSQSS